MEHIEINEYIRTKDGRIEKVKTVNKYCSITYKTLVSARVEEKINWYSESGREVNEEDITKHSPNIIYLIEVGDYVNGHKIVSEIWGEDDNNLYFEVEGGYHKATCIGEKDIKTILTKEQYKNECFKVGGKDE